MEEEKKWRKLGLERIVRHEDFQRMEEKSELAAERAFCRTREKQRMKFERMLSKQQKQDNERRDLAQKGKWVQNLSSYNLTEAEEKVLERGMNFAPTPKRIPKMDIVAGVEAALLSQRKLTPEKAEQARATVTNLLANAQPPRQNVSKYE